MRFSEKLPLRTILVRWFRKPLQRHYEIKTFRVYWVIKTVTGKARSFVSELIFKTRGYYGKQRQSIRVIRDIIKPVIRQVMLGLAIIIVLELIQKNLSSNLQYITNEISATYVGIIKNVLSRESDSTLLLTYAQISGILLGLYFAGISVVLSTAYANAPDNVRDKLIKEKFGNFYIKIVAVFGGLSLILLITQLHGVEPGRLSILFVSLLGLIALLGFVNLGLRVFGFFNPINLAKDLSREIFRWIKAASPKGFRFEDLSFQDRYRIRAEESLDTYINLIHLACLKTHLRGKPLSDLGGDILRVLAYYSCFKNRIPGESLWFRRKLKFPDWLTASYAEIDIAVQTSTAIRGKEIPDNFWFENTIKEGIGKVNNALLETGEFKYSAELYNKLNSYFRLIANNYAYKETLYIWESLNPKYSLLKNVRTREPSASNRRNAELLNALGCVDTYWTGLISILLGFYDSIRREEITELPKTISRIDWNEEKTVYLTNVPKEVLHELESLKVLIKNEILIEGEVITAPWYQEQLALRGFIKYMDGGLNNIAEIIENGLILDCEYYIEKEEPFLASHLIRLGLEACAKFRSHLEEAKSTVAALMQLKKVEDLIPWPVFELSNYDKRIIEARELLVTKLAQSTPSLFDTDLGPDFPDFFGQNYCYLAQECYDAMASRNEKLFKNIFPTFFALCLNASEKLREILTHLQDEDRFGFMVQPLQDLICLSGYSMIYSDLYNMGFFQITRKLWEKYITDFPDQEKLIDLLHYLITHPFVSFHIYARGILRTAWEQDLSRKFKNAGIEYDRYTEMFIAEPRSDINITPMIRAVAKRSTLRLFDPRIVFGALFLKSYFDKQEKKLDWEFDGFLKAIEEETKHNSEPLAPPEPK